MSEVRWKIQRPAPDDFSEWRILYQGYADFYQFPLQEGNAERLWGWIQDETHECRGLVAKDPETSRLVGLAHFRPYARPLRASVGCFLDDLFVEPAARGSGAVDALFVEIRRISRERGWDSVRWITADNNYRARNKYDQVAARTSWIMYDMSIDDHDLSEANR